MKTLNSKIVVTIEPLPCRRQDRISPVPDAVNLDIEVDGRPFVSRDFWLTPGTNLQRAINHVIEVISAEAPGADAPLCGGVIAEEGCDEQTG